MDPAHTWRRMSDEEVKAAAANLDEYTEVGRQAVRAELQRRRLAAYKVETRSRTTSRPHPRNKPWLPPVSGLAASVMLGALCFGLAGGGHGVYAPMIVCFPYSMLLATLNQSIAMPHIVLARSNAHPPSGTARTSTYGARRPWPNSSTAARWTTGGSCTAWRAGTTSCGLAS